MAKSVERLSDFGRIEAAFKALVRCSICRISLSKGRGVLKPGYGLRGAHSC